MRKLFFIGFAFMIILYAAPTALHLIHTGAFPSFQLHSSEEAAKTESAASQSAATPAVTSDSKISVQIDGKAVEMPLEDYVLGVTSAEISNEFPPESIKAQAIAARTYAVYKMQRGNPAAHPDCAVCSDYTHCAAYRNIKDVSDENFSSIEKAVKETAGQIITYDESPIAAVFHAASGPKTESSASVWGGDDVPYLKSVVSPGGSSCESYEASVTVSADEFRKKAAEAFPAADVSGKPSSWFKASTRSDAGGIETVMLGGVSVTGSAVRSLFGLNSTNFTLTTTNDTITFHTVGYGHGVGLSQYGAKYMAEQGASYEEILSHYYVNTVLSNV